MGLELFASSEKATKLVRRYLKLQRKQEKLQKEIEKVKKIIAVYSKKTHKKYLRSGNILLKVRQLKRTVFPKADQPGREEVEKIMRNSKDWNKVITFDIIKLGMAYDKKELSKNILKKLRPYVSKENIIRITKSKIRRIGIKRKRKKR